MNSTDVPLIIFLQGGPGAASQFSAFNYIGPLKVVDKGSSMHIERNHLGWNGLGNLLVVDQPLGVGFSYDSTNHITQATEEAALYFTNFMYNFLKTWNCSDKDVYITGESFAGHYVPVFSQFLLSNRTLGIKLKGISIGGAYIDSYIQDNYFDSFLTSFGIVDEYTADMLQYYTVRSMMNVKHGRYAEVLLDMNIGRNINEPHFK
jgi:carboxypeptidase C (cathepsin A)